MTPLHDIIDIRTAFSEAKRAPSSLRIVVKRMKLGLLGNEFFGGSFDGNEVRQVELEKENRVLSRLLLELVDRRLGLFF